MSDLIEALQIFLKYSNPHCPFWVEYNRLNVIDVEPDDVTVADKERLEALGFSVDENQGNFYSFRFGNG